jgi:hypothetical protein
MGSLEILPLNNRLSSLQFFLPWFQSTKPESVKFSESLSHKVSVADNFISSFRLLDQTVHFSKARKEGNIREFSSVGEHQDRSAQISAHFEN